MSLTIALWYIYVNQGSCVNNKCPFKRPEAVGGRRGFRKCGKAVRCCAEARCLRLLVAGRPMLRKRVNETTLPWMFAWNRYAAMGVCLPVLFLHP